MSVAESFASLERKIEYFERLDPKELQKVLVEGRGDFLTVFAGYGSIRGEKVCEAIEKASFARRDSEYENSGL